MEQRLTHVTLISDKFTGKGTRVSPFIPYNLTNSESITLFFDYVILPPAENATQALFMEIFAGSYGTHFVIEASKNEHNHISFKVAPQLGFLATNYTCLKDLRDLNASLRQVAITGFSLTEGSSSGFENSEFTFVPEKANNPTIKMCLESEPFLNTTISFVES